MSRSRLGPRNLYLQTFGSPLLLAHGEPLPSRRVKDMALLVYMCIDGKPAYSRQRLASLLWGNRPEARGRHSLTQALRRLTDLVGTRHLTVHRDTVTWHGELRCDALELEEAHGEDLNLGEDLEWRDFLVAFDPGSGSEEFRFWSDERRSHFRRIMVKVLGSMGADAEREEDWSRAVELAHRTIEVEPLFEQGHRRLMRAWSELGERALALQHYRHFAGWLNQEIGADPDPTTQALARELGAGQQPGVHRSAPSRPEAPSPSGSGSHASGMRKQDVFRASRVSGPS